MDPELSFTTLDTDPLLVSSRNAWGAFPGSAVGFLHGGGQATYGAGFILALANGGGASVRGLYEREHGECELEIPWQSFLDGVLSEIGATSGEGDCNFLFCPDYDMAFSQRVARSYLRRSSSGAIAGGRGGFGVHMKGEVEFDSPFVDDLSFFGRALYDVSLAEGLPKFQVVGGPWANTWDCSASPFTSCPEKDVRDAVRADLAQAAGGLNAALDECAVAPLEWGCSAAESCASTASPAGLLGEKAKAEALARGMSESRADQFRKALLTAESWRCAPVSSTCSSLTGAEVTEEPVCQLVLRATDIVPMPDSFSLVWYSRDFRTSGPVTAAGALYLALTQLQQTDELAKLCSPPAQTRVRAFVRRSK
jgi:hypothetical protein